MSTSGGSHFDRLIEAGIITVSATRSRSAYADSSTALPRTRSTSSSPSRAVSTRPTSGTSAGPWSPTRSRIPVCVMF